jgi:predicted dehydrogenase
MQAARAGKAILLEKPMALNKNELDQLTAVLQETGVPFMVGFNRRYSPAAQRIREIISERKNPVMIFYRMNAGYLPADHWTQTEEGGGRMIGEACHIFDLFQYVVGAPVVEVNSTAITPQTGHILAGDNMTVTLRYADGSVATLLYTALGSPDLSKEYMEIYNDGKVLVMDDYLSLRGYGFPLKGLRASVQDKGHHEELKAFAECVKNKSPFPIEIDSLVDTTKVSFLVQKALAETGGN